MPILRKTCAHCGKAYTEKEMAERIEAQRQNAFASRAKAKANGKKLGRKTRADAVKVNELFSSGRSIRGIAKDLGVNRSSVYRVIQKIKKEHQMDK